MQPVRYRLWHATTFLPRTATIVEQMARSDTTGPRNNRKPDDAGGQRFHAVADAADPRTFTAMEVTRR